MNTKGTFLLLVLLAFCAATAQETWDYKGTITFPAADTAWARPYLCKVDGAGNDFVLLDARGGGGHAANRSTPMPPSRSPGAARAARPPIV
jgi:hypothetical protein